MQGFNWFTNSLKLDADGDAAHDFLGDHHEQQPSSLAGAAAVDAGSIAQGSEQGPSSSSAGTGTDMSRGGSSDVEGSSGQPVQVTTSCAREEPLGL